jgi:dTDP-4-dehydrorhamnose reductase
MKKVLIVGMGGQLGYELKKNCPADIELSALTEQELDITNRELVADFIKTSVPELIINCAAYTNVDKAEKEPEKAFKVNAEGPENLAVAAKKHGCRLIHISTDFVFDGNSSIPYKPEDEPKPINVYGKSKLAGEHAVLNSGANATIIRTSWLYSAHGNNFVKTMIRLMNEKESLGVVADQIGSPTWAGSLASFIWALSDNEFKGTLHWSDAGVASWYDFAVAIYEEGKKLGLINNDTVIKPIETKDFPTPAKRPFYSVMNKKISYEKVKESPVHWRKNLRTCLNEIKNH